MQDVAEDFLGFVAHIPPQIPVQARAQRRLEALEERLSNALFLFFFFGAELVLAFVLQLGKTPTELFHFGIDAALALENVAAFYLDIIHVPCSQPLAGEIIDQPLGALVREHAGQLR